MNPSQHDFVPPPAYSAREFDTKMSLARAASTITQPPQQQVEEEEWEQWDDAVFDAAASSGQAISSSDHRRESRAGSSPTATRWALPARPGEAGPSVPPLKIHKKNRSSTGSSSKQRPSWYAEAGLDSHQSSNSMRPVSPAAPGSLHAVPVRIGSNGQDYSIPPPPFTAVGPSLEGPPFEEMDPLSFRPNPPPSRPPSRAPSVSPSQFRGALPLPSIPPVRRVSRADPAVGPDTGASRMSFNPAVAYNKHKDTQAVTSEYHPPIQSFDATALYHSSVASQLTIVPSQRPQ
ncbi:uncharacterized protein BT62DRAFT_668278 [Guyanagaster necrorhizus]|uniref:Uncharacterized protein n=1 Tax=Guyanagaster necrorhizus TaxID=856835 RepID=A0A9P8AVD2_9AGAR|nr:uncharacterized protein BT62DRAFT_668278 [Guyanagaster necrorhizus MCA 3950]KAG7449180.1 hypothetical protein BT62DRAFT_668278 [Guyanagaster necrorhizus MCA 3950]